MRLADEIENWGISQAERLDVTERDRLRRIWSVVRRSDEASLDILQLTHGDGTRVIELFDLRERSDVASTLNEIVTSGRRRARTYGGDEIDDDFVAAADGEPEDDTYTYTDADDDTDVIDARDPRIIADEKTFARAASRPTTARTPVQPQPVAARPRSRFFWLYITLASLVLGSAMGAGFWLLLG